MSAIRSLVELLFFTLTTNAIRGYLYFQFVAVFCDKVSYIRLWQMANEKYHMNQKIPMLFYLLNDQRRL